jgi:hypothetical protein
MESNGYRGYFFGGKADGVQRVPGVFSSAVERMERADEHSPLSNSEFENAWNFTSTPLSVFMA